MHHLLPLSLLAVTASAFDLRLRPAPRNLAMATAAPADPVLAVREAVAAPAATLAAVALPSLQKRTCNTARESNGGGHWGCCNPDDFDFL